MYRYKSCLSKVKELSAFIFIVIEVIRSGGDGSLDLSDIPVITDKIMGKAEALEEAFRSSEQFFYIVLQALRHADL